MQTLVLPVGPYEANCVVAWEDPAKAWLVDPGAEPELIFAALTQKGVTPALILLTHGHFDHISSVADILKKYPVPVYLHADDEPVAFSPLNVMPPYLGAKKRWATLDTSKGDGDTLACGGLTATFIHTPGHTPGSCCIYFKKDKLLLTGDTLFAGSVGRTDFPGGSATALSRSLQLLKVLPDDLRVIPGHGEDTNLGEEKKSNPYLR